MRAVVFWMMKNAAESSQMRAAKHAMTKGKGIGNDVAGSLDRGCDAVPVVKFARTIPSTQRTPAVMAWVCGVAVKSDGTLQSK